MTRMEVDARCRASPSTLLLSLHACISLTCAPVKRFMFSAAMFCCTRVVSNTAGWLIGWYNLIEYVSSVAIVPRWCLQGEEYISHPSLQRRMAHLLLKPIAFFADECTSD